MWGAVIGAAASVIGSSMQSDAAGDAASAQSQSSAAAIAEQQRQYDQNRTDLAPYRTAGASAVTRLAALLGLDPAAGGFNPGSYVPPGAQDLTGWAQARGYNLPENRDWDSREQNNLYDAGYRQYLEDYQKAHPTDTSPASGFGDLNKKFTMSDFENDPVIQKSFEFGISEGEKAVQRMFGARGMSRSGAAVKAALRYANDYTGTQAGASRDRFVQDQTNLYNRLAGVSGTGQTAAQNTASLGTNIAGNIADITVGEGNARGAASIARGNAMAGGFAGVGNAANNYFTLDRILNRNNNRAPSNYYSDFAPSNSDTFYGP